MNTITTRRHAVLAVAATAVTALAVSSCAAGVKTTPSGTATSASATATAKAATSSPAATHTAAPAGAGSYFDVKDASGDTYRITLVKVIDPAQGADQFSSPDNGKRFVGAVFTVKALNGSPKDEDANNDAALTGSDGQSYTADFNSIAGYTDFNSGVIQVAQGDTSTGAVTFQVPSGVKVAKVQWTPGGFGATVQWDVSR